MRRPAVGVVSTDRATIDAAVAEVRGCPVARVVCFQREGETTSAHADMLSNDITGGGFSIAGWVIGDSGVGEDSSFA